MDSSPPSWRKAFNHRGHEGSQRKIEEKTSKNGSRAKPLTSLASLVFFVPFVVCFSGPPAAILEKTG
jgi:hypothetical protein